MPTAEELAAQKQLDDRILAVFNGEDFATKLGETIAKYTHEAINKYDKNQKKTLTGFEATLKQIQEALEASKANGTGSGDGSGSGDGGTGTGSGDGKGNGQLPPEVAKRLEASANAIKALEKQLADQKKVVETEKQAREKVEAEREQMALTDAIRTAAISKEVGADPNRVDVLLDHLLHRSMVVKNDSGNGYRIVIGTDNVGEPVYAPLDEGLKKFLSSDRGLMFKPAVKGSGVDVNANAGGGGGGAGGKKFFAADVIRAGQPGGMTGAQVREALANGTLTADEA